MSSAGTVLVTGATGFVGSVLTRQLVDEGCEVRIFRRDTSSLNLLDTYAERVDHAVGDVTRARSLYEAMEGVERVYHVAAKVSFAPGEQEALRRVNADGTANVVNAALRAGVRRLVHTSSMAAFGRPEEPGGAIDETTEWQGAPHRSAYARSKRRAELEVHRGIAEGLDATLVNPSGPIPIRAESSTPCAADGSPPCPRAAPTSWTCATWPQASASPWSTETQAAATSWAARTSPGNPSPARWRRRSASIRRAAPCRGGF